MGVLGNQQQHEVQPREMLGSAAGMEQCRTPASSWSNSVGRDWGHWWQQTQQGPAVCPGSQEANHILGCITQSMTNRSKT